MNYLSWSIIPPYLSLSSSNVMDKLVLTSSKALSDTSRYAVGVMRDNSLHLTPITTVLALRPSFSYLDQADKRGRQDRKDTAGEEGDKH